mgnify:CR=1 FL=1|tara:strand:- start:670 stop:1011 length:342 start_codon:yes stop_codon:yes gene_type:complete
MLEAFKKIDLDGNGYIESAELEQAIRAMVPQRHRTRYRTRGTTRRPCRPAEPLPTCRCASPTPAAVCVVPAQDPNISGAKCKEMMQFADADGDGKVVFEEYKKILMYKPSAAP